MVGGLLELQRTAGNQAVSGALAVRRPVVQRHSSWEHAMLGDTPPGQLRDAAGTVPNPTRTHVIEAELQRMRFFQFRTDVAADPRSKFPDVRWIQLRASGLWVSYGELNALADYLPDPAAADTQTRQQLVPVLQRMRQSIARDCAEALGQKEHDFAGAERSVFGSGHLGDYKAQDAATAASGVNRHAGMVARNACHFAPLSWERWTLFHNEARQAATAHHASGKGLAPAGNVDTAVDEHQRQAILKNGYADHFLQDSFAAGHLINKTLVMQWFVEWLNQRASWSQEPWFGQPDAELAGMTAAQQPGIAGRQRYGRPPTSTGTSEADRASGAGQTDPQTAEERTDRERRVAGSGVVATPGRTVEDNYQLYLRFLNNAFVQGSSGALHDHLNRLSLVVENRSGDRYRVGGDDSLLTESDRGGAELAGRAAELSRTAIAELLATGATAITVDQIFALFPQRVLWARREYSLAEFQDDVLHDLCVREIFPAYVSSGTGIGGRLPNQGEMVTGGVSRDAVPARAPNPAP